MSTYFNKILNNFYIPKIQNCYISKIWKHVQAS